MQHLRTTLNRTAQNSVVKKVTYVRAAYQPADCPMSFPEEQRTALVYTGEGETVSDVMNYHYPNRHHIVAIH